MNQWILTTVYNFQCFYFTLSTQQWPASLSAPTGVDLCSLFPDLHRQASQHAGYFTNRSPVCDCWWETNRSCNKKEETRLWDEGWQQRPSWRTHELPLQFKNTLQQLCILTENQGGEKIHLGCDRLVGIPVDLGRVWPAPDLCNANVASVRPAGCRVSERFSSSVGELMFGLPAEKD